MSLSQLIDATFRVSKARMSTELQTHLQTNAIGICGTLFSLHMN